MTSYLRHSAITAKAIATAKVVEGMLADNPRMTALDLAESVGVSGATVYKILNAKGLKPGKAPPRPYTPREAKAPGSRMVTAVPSGPINHTTCGTIAELIAATDMLARGWQVFFPLVRTTKCDLLATDPKGVKVVRIEVRAGKRDKAGKLVFAQKAGAACDHYAVVLVGEPVIYKPELPGVLARA